MQSLKWQNWALGVLLSVCTACAGPTDGTDFGGGEEQSAPADTAESSTLDDGVSEGGADGLEPGPDVPEEPADSESAEDVGGGEGGEADGSTEPLEDVEGSEGDGTDDTEEPGDEDERGRVETDVG